MKPTAAERVAQALEILAEVSHNPNSSAVLRDMAEQVRFDLLKAFGAYQAERTAAGAEQLRAALGRVIAIYDRSIRLPASDPLAGFRPVRTMLG